MPRKRVLLDTAGSSNYFDQSGTYDDAIYDDEDGFFNDTPQFAPKWAPSSSHLLVTAHPSSPLSLTICVVLPTSRWWWRPIVCARRSRSIPALWSRVRPTLFKAVIRCCALAHCLSINAANRIWEGAIARTTWIETPFLYKKLFLI